MTTEPIPGTPTEENHRGLCHKAHPGVRHGAWERQRRALSSAVDEGRNVLPDATDDQAQVIEAWAIEALYGDPQLSDHRWRAGWDVLYDYVLREWCDDFDTPAAEESTRQILDTLAAAGLVVRPDHLYTTDSYLHGAEPGPPCLICRSSRASHS